MKKICSQSENPSQSSFLQAILNGLYTLMYLQQKKRVLVQGLQSIYAKNNNISTSFV